ncbi:MAG: carboxymuconolactone decarboxylase family protein [Alphaproteobacteria bacterium]|nr:carboxymuconolactone decarboxylase family protein [Alphaproteobacteria bacterium]
MTRSELRRRGGAIHAQLFGPETEAAEPAGGVGFDALMAELVYGSLWTRPGLSLPDRLLITLSALCVTRQSEPLRRFVGAAVGNGVAPNSIVETLIQCGIYAGFSTSEEALAIAGAVFAERGIEMPTTPPRVDPLETLAARGEAVMASLHAERRHLGHAAPDNPVTSSLYPLVIQYCYGEIWDRPGLDRRTRALIAVAGFAALGHDGLLGKFARSALNVGATETEIVETIIQIGPYAGFAFALKALTIAGDAFGRTPS